MYRLHFFQMRLPSPCTSQTYIPQVDLAAWIILRVVVWAESWIMNHEDQDTCSPPEHVHLCLSSHLARIYACLCPGQIPVQHSFSLIFLWGCESSYLPPPLARMMVVRIHFCWYLRVITRSLEQFYRFFHSFLIRHKCKWRNNNEVGCSSNTFCWIATWSITDTDQLAKQLKYMFKYGDISCSWRRPFAQQLLFRKHERNLQTSDFIFFFFKLVFVILLI